MKKILFTLLWMLVIPAFSYANEKVPDFPTMAKYLNEQLKIWGLIILIIAIIIGVFGRIIKNWFDDWFDKFFN